MHYPDSRWRPRCERKSRDDVSGRIIEKSFFISLGKLCLKLTKCVTIVN